MFGTLLLRIPLLFPPSNQWILCLSMRATVFNCKVDMSKVKLIWNNKWILFSYTTSPNSWPLYSVTICEGWVFSCLAPCWSKWQLQLLDLARLQWHTFNALHPRGCFLRCRFWAPVTGANGRDNCNPEHLQFFVLSALFYIVGGLVEP